MATEWNFKNSQVKNSYRIYGFNYETKKHVFGKKNTNKHFYYFEAFKKDMEEVTTLVAKVKFIKSNKDTLGGILNSSIEEPYHFFVEDNFVSVGDIVQIIDGNFVQVTDIGTTEKFGYTPHKYLKGKVYRYI